MWTFGKRRPDPAEPPPRPRLPRYIPVGDPHTWEREKFLDGPPPAGDRKRIRRRIRAQRKWAERDREAVWGPDAPYRCGQAMFYAMQTQERRRREADPLAFYLLWKKEREGRGVWWVRKRLRRLRRRMRQLRQRWAMRSEEHRERNRGARRSR